MGMPISSYTVLKALSDGGQGNEIAIAQDVLHPFNLFAFIIHDPEAHPVFDETIKQGFRPLDRATGDKLLFFALVDPPEDWLKDGRYRDYYRYYQDLGAQLRDPKNAINSSDKDITALSLAHSLEISTDDLPCIVITSDFRSSNLIWFRTCSEHVHRQFTELGLIASDIEDRTRPPGKFYTLTEEDFETLSSKIDLCGKSGFNDLESSSLAKALTDVLDCIVAGNSPNLTERQKATERAKNTLSNLSDQLEELKNRPDKNNIEALENLSVKIVSFLAHLNSRDLSLDGFVSIERKLLEYDSYRLLKTAHKAIDLLEHNIDDNSIDYTPGVICLGKAFEREINLSIVHWMRQLHGVTLPKYFNRYQPNLDGEIPPFLNQSKSRSSDTWKPPTLGESEHHYKKIIREHQEKICDSKMSLDKWNTLSTYWEAIRIERNPAAHSPDRVERASFNKVKSALSELANKRVFEDLYNMKVAYRGVIKILDTNLRIAIAKDLKKEPDDALISISDMKNLISLSAKNGNICDLAGLEFATNLQNLEIDGNKITDISPLSSLTELGRLSLNNNEITDISPLSSLTKLKSLDFDGNKITDISPLSSLTKLKSLDFDGNKITDISPLSSLTNLGKLSLNNNEITNISPLSSLTKLKSLYLKNNKITDISPLSSLTNLEWLSLNNNEITDISPLSSLTNLKWLSLNDNGITDISPLSSLTKSESLYLTW